VSRGHWLTHCISQLIFLMELSQQYVTNMGHDSPTHQPQNELQNIQNSQELTILDVLWLILIGKSMGTQVRVSLGMGTGIEKNT
jgi:hypothetical protein